MTKDDLMSIAYRKNGGRYYNEDVIPEDYTPQAIEPEKIDEDLQQKMWETWRYDGNWLPIFFVYYYGCFNGAYVVATASLAIMTEPEFCTVEKITIYGGGERLRVYIPKEAHPEIVKQIRESRENVNEQE